MPRVATHTVHILLTCPPDLSDPPDCRCPRGSTMFIRNLLLNRTKIPLLSKTLNVASLRHKAITNNVANVNTGVTPVQWTDSALGCDS